jgi:hypothetical protein
MGRYRDYRHEWSKLKKLNRFRKPGALTQLGDTVHVVFRDATRNANGYERAGHDARLP